MKLSKCVGAIALGIALAGAPAFAEDVQYKTITRDDMPREARHQSDVQTKGGSDVQYQRRTEGGKTLYSLHWTKDGKRWEARLDEQGKVVDGPQEARDQARAGRGSDDAKQGGDDVNVKYHGISAKDVNKEVPEAVRKTMDKHIAGATDLFYQSQIRDGKKFYSVHYNKDGKRMFVRVADNGELALGPAESTGKDYKPKKDKIVADAPVKREAVTVEQLPAAVRKTVETSTGGGTDHSFVKQSRGDETLYVVEFNRNGQRTSAIIDAEGKIVEGESLAAAAPTPAPGPTPVPPPATTDPAITKAKAEADAQLAANREAATAPYQLLSSADQLPPEVRAAAEKSLAGSSDPLFQRYIENGQTAYSVHFTGPEGRRNFMAIDQAGKVVIEPRKSKWQDGSKGVRFEAVGAEQLPAEVRKSIEGQGGTAHIFVKRTQPNGKELYLTQYTVGGERMEAEVSPEGKLIGKARAAEEQPFATLDKKQKKN